MKKKIIYIEEDGHKILIICKREGVREITKFNKRDKKEILSFLSYQLGVLNCFNSNNIENNCGLGTSYLNLNQ